MSLIGTITALAPECVLLVGACAALIVGVARPEATSRAAAPVALLTVVIALVVAWILPAGGEAEILPGIWITTLSLYTRWITLAVGVPIILVNWRQPAEIERGEYMALILFSLLGVLLTGLANDLVVLFFAIELVSVPTYVLIALSRTDVRASEASVKYFFLGALSAAILAYGLSFLYGATGTTTLYALTEGAAESAFRSTSLIQAYAIIGFLLFFAGLAFKIAAVPFHVYAADVYEGAAAPITGLLGFVPKLAGFLALVKIMAAFDWNLPASVQWTIWLVAAATMTTGNVLALLQKNVKRMLAYSSIAHTGYMLVAVLVGPVVGRGPMRDGVAAMLFYIVVYGTMNLGAFAMLTAFRRGDREIETIEDLGGIARRAPAAALAFAVCTFSLMGIPPTAGFLGKIYIFSSAFSFPPAHPMREAMIVLVVIAVINTAIGAAYYLRIASAAYLGAESAEVVPAAGAPVRWGLALCSIPLILLFLRPAPLADRAGEATIVLQDTVRYDASVASSAPPGDTIDRSRRVLTPVRATAESSHVHRPEP